MLRRGEGGLNMASSGSKGTPCKKSLRYFKWTRTGQAKTDLIRLASGFDLSPKHAKGGFIFVRRSRACIRRSCEDIKQALANDG